MRHKTNTKYGDTQSTPWDTLFRTCELKMFAVYFLSYEIKDTMSKALTLKYLFVHDSPAVASDAVCLLYRYLTFIDSIPL